MSTSYELAKYVGSMFGTVIGGYLGVVESLVAAYNGDLRAVMRDLSLNPVWANTNAVGSTREVAHDLVNRLVGDTASAADKEWAVNWFADMKDAGSTWGDILYAAITALDAITEGPWAAAGAALRARADYNALATEGWAADVYDLDTMRDAFSAAVTPAGFTASGSNPSAISALTAGNAALDTAAAALGNASADTSSTVASGDAGKALMLGGGDDTVTVSWARLDKQVLISGGSGMDKLAVNGSAQEYVDFANKYGGFFNDQPLRGFETIEFQGVNPFHIGSIDGVRQYSFTVGAGQQPLDATFYGIDNGTTISLNLAAANGTSYVHFKDMANYNSAFPSDTAPQVVDSLTFNVAGGTSGGLYLSHPPAKDIQVNVSAPFVSTFWWTLGDVSDMFAIDFSYLEELGIASAARTNMLLDAPNLRVLSLVGSTGSAKLSIDGTGGKSNDGLIDTFEMFAGSGLTHFTWDSNSDSTDSSVQVAGDLLAGSVFRASNDGNFKVANVPVVKASFGSNFSQAGYYQANGLSDVSGSLFDVAGFENAAVYFKGAPSGGQTLGTVAAHYGQTTLVKVDSATTNLEVKVDIADTSGSILVFVNTGSGSVLDAVRAEVQAQLDRPLLEKIVAGGRILYTDVDGNGDLTAPIYSNGAWNVTTDFVIMETTSANLATMSSSVELLGFAPIVDPFL